MSKDNRARASASEGLTLHARLTFLFRRSRSPAPDVQHLMGEKATNTIDALPQRFRLFGSLVMQAQRLQQRITAQPLLMKVPVPIRSRPEARGPCVWRTESLISHFRKIRPWFLPRLKTDYETTARGGTHSAKKALTNDASSQDASNETHQNSHNRTLRKRCTSVAGASAR